MSDYTEISYADSVPAPEAIADGAGVAGNYLDSLAGWIMLVPSKVQALLTSGATIKGALAWIVALYLIGVGVYMLRHWKAVLAEARRLILTPAGIISSGLNSAIVWAVVTVLNK